MKKINGFLMRSVTALIIGLVLVVWPDVAIDYLVITIGVLFILPGLLVTLGYLTAKHPEMKRRFPIEGVGSVLFGLWLVIMPGFFADVLMLLLGFILMMGGIQQLSSLFLARKWVSVPAGYYIIPLLIALAGLFVVVNPTGVRNTAFVIIGITCLVYALSDLLNWFRFMRQKPKPTPSDTSIEDAQIIEDDK
ncbi:DUF308 domain-containing protein [uncultured Bacteroides sp.]|uniref:HdeD family acid-resistance protein n=1 Tax=uncultured Bacteroides sp. TaxID=162156 RepID=UPI002AAAD3BD|nr:DUF308 domain-containing protein [uncultured Bacteroides sp.]